MKPVRVSRHAIERWMERVGAPHELEALAEIRGMINRSGFFGTLGWIKRGPVSLVIQDRVVVTVLTAEKRPKHRTRQRFFEDEAGVF